jgi:hypothetical protein
MRNIAQYIKRKYKIGAEHNEGNEYRCNQLVLIKVFTFPSQNYKLSYHINKCDLKLNRHHYKYTNYKSRWSFSKTEKYDYIHNPFSSRTALGLFIVDEDYKYSLLIPIDCTGKDIITIQNFNITLYAEYLSLQKIAFYTQ